MPSMNAAFPASAMSMMSPPERGQSRTLLPFLSSTPSTTTLSSVGLPSCSRKKSTLLPQHPELPDGPVQLHKLLRRKGFAPLQYLPPPRVGGAHLFFLLVREGENGHDEQLIDLRSVEEIPGALGGDLGIVVEDDRGGEHRVPLPLFSDQHRPHLYVLAPLRGFPKLLRWIGQRDELSPLYLQRRVGRGEGLLERALPVLASPRGGVGYPDRYLEESLAQGLGPYLYRSAQGAPPTHHSPHDVPGGILQRLVSTPLGNVYLYSLGGSQ